MQYMDQTLSARSEPARGPRLIDSERFPALLDGRFSTMRPGTGLKILHVTNVAQNAYVNASILTARGHDCDVFAPDLYHASSSPEWYELFEADIDADRLGGDPGFPDFYALGRDIPRIPDWVAHGPFFAAMFYLILRRRRDPLAHAALCVLAYCRFKATMQKNTMVFAVPMSDEEFGKRLSRYDIPAYLRRRIVAGRLAERYFEWVRSRLRSQMPEEEARALIPPWSLGSLDGYFPCDGALGRVVGSLRTQGLSQLIGLEFPGPLGCMPFLAAAGFDDVDTVTWTWSGHVWRELASLYDVCIFYGDSSRFAFAAGIRGYCTLEHGTIRSVPFEDTTSGRLLAKAYLNAARVFLTNTDYATAAPRLDFQPAQRVYAFHPFDEVTAANFCKTYSRRLEPDAVVFFCPARQDWRSGDPRMAKGNNEYFAAAKSLLDQGRSNFKLICVDHGLDCEATRQMIEEFGLASRVQWVPLLSKRKFWSTMLDAHALIDQFVVSAFGGVTFEALALGCRIITKDNGINNRVFFEEPPPLMAAANAAEIAQQMLVVMNDPMDEAGIGQRCAEWVHKYHSAEELYQLQMRAFAELPPVSLTESR